MRNGQILFLLLLFGLSSLLVAAEQQATGPATTNRCLLPEQKQLEFWVGEWELTWPGAPGGPAGHGSNSIRRILDGCVVEENFSGGESLPLRGKSVSLYDVRSHHWKQTWVDNSGAYLDFVGEFKDRQMILTRQAVGPDRKPQWQRMVWKNISASELDWSWEASTDGGKTWQVLWPIHYRRKP